MILIAEIGNNHFGSMKKAKELIRAAKESGASMVKGQAIKSGSFFGSMPPEFYDMIDLGFLNYAELIEYGKSLGIIVFFTSIGYDELYMVQKVNKLSAGMSEKRWNYIEKYDKEFNIISVRNIPSVVDIKKAMVFYATDYLIDTGDIDINKKLNQTRLMCVGGRDVGFSDHSYGIDNCLRAYEYGAKAIEKHFTLEKDMTFKGKVFRDTVHGITPNEFEILAKKIGVN